MNECACGFDEQESVFPLNPMLGQSYVPMQKMTNVSNSVWGVMIRPFLEYFLSLS